jgi:hypothetical protein
VSVTCVPPTVTGPRAVFPWERDTPTRGVARVYPQGAGTTVRYGVSASFFRSGPRQPEPGTRNPEPGTGRKSAGREPVGDRPPDQDKHDQPRPLPGRREDRTVRLPSGLRRSAAAPRTTPGRRDGHPDTQKWLHHPAPDPHPCTTSDLVDTQSIVPAGSDVVRHLRISRRATCSAMVLASPQRAAEILRTGGMPGRTRCRPNWWSVSRRGLAVGGRGWVRRGGGLPGWWGQSRRRRGTGTGAGCGRGCLRSIRSTRWG